MNDEEPKREAKKWERFERLVYEIQKDFAGTGATVTHREYIMGADSKVEREIDISIRQQVAQYPILVVIDCKDYAEPIDVKTIEEFAGLVKDVRANKGVMVSSNGFTPAAINVAKNAGIDTLRLIDSKGVDWKNYIAVPLLIVWTHLEKSFLNVSGIGHIVLPYATEELFELQMYTDDGTLLGTPLKVMHRKWNKEEIPHEPGTYEVELGKQVNVEYRGVRSKIDISATVAVSREFHLGPLPIYTQGFQDHQRGSIITKEFRTDSINTNEIVKGNVPGWRKLDATEAQSVKVSMALDVSSGYGDENDFEETGEIQMHRKATSMEGQLCNRCNRTISGCGCTDAQLDQFLAESESDQKIVNRMLFISNAPPEIQKKDWSELIKLYKDNGQLAMRNGVASPFLSTGI